MPVSGSERRDLLGGGELVLEPHFAGPSAPTVVVTGSNAMVTSESRSG
jgi:hypothetical protein